MVPRRNSVVRHTPERVNAGKRYCDMEIIIRPYVEHIRDSIEQLRTLFATDGLDDEGHGYTYRIMVFVVKKAGKKFVITLIKRNDNLCTNFHVIEDGDSYEIEGFHFWMGQRKGNATPGPGDGLMVLPRQYTGPPPRWRHIKIVEEVTGSWAIAVMRSDTMYCKGIINMDWSCYELQETNPDRTRKLPPEYNATDAGCDVSYHSMMGCRLEDVRQKLIDEGLGFGSAVRSVKILSRYHPARLNSEDHPAGMALASLIFSIFEAARMNLRYSGLDAKNNGRYWSIGQELTSQLWDLSQNWRNMSYTVLDCRDTGYLEWTPNKYLYKIGRTTLELTVGALSIVLNSPEWYYYEIVGQKPTRMELVLYPRKRRRFKQLVKRVEEEKRRLMVMGPPT